MLQEVKLWKQKFKDGFEIANNFYFEHSVALPKNITKIAFFGMGGSGISGHIVKAFLDKKSSIPSFVIDSPEVPAYIDTETLAIVVSYSGNTWETLEAFDKLTLRHIPTISISSNGKLLELAESKNILFMISPKSRTPRSALGSFLGMILGLLDLMGIMQGKTILKSLEGHVDKYLPKLEDEAYYKDFIALAKDREFFHIFGVAGDSASAAYRAQTQFNENSKVSAVFSALPEANHNLLVGFSHITKRPLIILYSTDFISPALEVSIEALSEVLKEQGVDLYNPPILGDNWEEQLFHIILWSDFASFFLAKAKNIEAEPVLLIEKLKEKHKQKSIK